MDIESIKKRHAIRLAKAKETKLRIEQDTLDTMIQKKKPSEEIRSQKIIILGILKDIRNILKDNNINIKTFLNS